MSSDSFVTYLPDRSPHSAVMDNCYLEILQEEKIRGEPLATIPNSSLHGCSRCRLSLHSLSSTDESPEPVNA